MRASGDLHGGPVHCAHCGAEIVFCLGGETGWMHETTRREHCPDNVHLATALEVMEP